MPVKSPITKTTRWPRSWKCFIFRIRTVWPRWMSGAVGSKPTLTVSGRPQGELGLERVRRHDVDGAARQAGEGVLRAHSPSTITRRPRPAAALEQRAHRARVDPVLGLEDARGERLLGVAREHRHRLLGHDRPGVEALVDEVHGGAAHLHAVLERLALRVQARERPAAARGGRSGSGPGRRARSTGDSRRM